MTFAVKQTHTHARTDVAASMREAARTLTHSSHTHTRTYIRCVELCNRKTSRLPSGKAYVVFAVILAAAAAAAEKVAVAAVAAAAA